MPDMSMKQIFLDLINIAIHEEFSLPTLESTGTETTISFMTIPASLKATLPAVIQAAVRCARLEEPSTIFIDREIAELGCASRSRDPSIASLVKAAKVRVMSVESDRERDAKETSISN